MGTPAQLRTAAVAALTTALLLAGALFAVRGGPPSSNADTVLTWHASHATMAKAGAILWLLAMLGLVAFAVMLREAMWAAIADRNWVTVLFQQGATVFAIVAVASAAVGWAVAEEAAAGTITAETAGAMWSLQRTLLRFATWGFTAPLAVVALALYRHSFVGKLCAAGAVVIAVSLLLPPTWTVALVSVPSWLLLTATALVLQAARHPGDRDVLTVLGRPSGADL